jgi:hypothetical protein
LGKLSDLAEVHQPNLPQGGPTTHETRDGAA